MMYESTRIMESGEGDQPRTNAERDDRQQHQPHKEDQRTRGQERHEERSRSRNRQPRHEERGNEAMEETVEPEGNGERRQYPESPRPRRRNPDAPEEGGWDVIDNLTVDQCARMPVGMQTVEVVPNSLKDEWTKAWNDVHMMRDGAETDEIRDRALKLILWIPHGLLHASSRGGKKGARQFRDLVRRFVMLRQRDMTGVMKAWRQAAITAEKRIEKARARKERGDRARISRAVKLIRRGAISRAGKAMEIRGLGDLQDGSIWEHIEAKHPE